MRLHISKLAHFQIGFQIKIPAILLQGFSEIFRLQLSLHMVLFQGLGKGLTVESGCIYVYVSLLCKYVPFASSFPNNPITLLAICRLI